MVKIEFKVKVMIFVLYRYGTAEDMPRGQERVADEKTKVGISRILG